MGKRNFNDAWKEAEKLGCPFIRAYRCPVTPIMYFYYFDEDGEERSMPIATSKNKYQRFMIGQTIAAWAKTKTRTHPELFQLKMIQDVATEYALLRLPKGFLK
jgi:hypothetical protein